jgi:hypothetical protein
MHHRTSVRRGGFITMLVVLALLVLALAAAPGAQAYNLYFGDLHSHSEISDGGGLPYDAYTQAMAAGADFLAVTDHSSQVSAAEWAALKETAAELTTNRFVAIPSYEITFGWGHQNAYGVPDLPLKKTGNQGGRNDIIPSYYDWLASYGAASSQWNHPTQYSKEFDGFAYRTDARDGVVNLLEIWSNSYQTIFETSYVKALDLGWHVMPTANSDTHITDWIVGYEARTVLLADALTPADLYGAMRARRGYATRDKDLAVEYTLNGGVMGTVRDGAETSYLASVTVDDPVTSTPVKIELVTDGGAVAAATASWPQGTAWTPAVTSSTSRYYYVRVTTDGGAGGATAWTAPVWTGR